MSWSLALAAKVTVVVTVVCFLVAGAVGQDQDGWLGDALPQWLGSIAWFGFLLGVLASVLLGVALLVRRATGRRAPGDSAAR